MAVPTLVFLLLSALQFSGASASSLNYISYGALSRNSVPCSRRESSYYNCRPSPNTTDSHRINLGSSLSPSSTNSSWLSPSGRFSFGFYPQGNGGFGVGIWYAQIPQHTLVWTPDRDDPPFSANATLRLTSGGRLILQRTQHDPEEDFVYDGGQTKESNISWASIVDEGNFVLFDSGSNVLWQSFDFPTNTILPDQRLLSRDEISSVSETNYNSINGRFRLLMQHDGNLVQYYSTGKRSVRYSYWESGTNTYRGRYVTLQLDDDGNLYMFDRDGLTVKNLSLSTGGGGTPTGDTVLYRLTIDNDGIFRVYSINADDQKSKWSIMWESSTDKCVPFGICGNNAYCTYTPMEDQPAVCHCIPGFDFIDKTQQSSDCQQSEQGCSTGNQTQNGNFFMSTLEKIEWKEDQYKVLSSTPTEGKCKEACLADSNCEIALFGDDQSCRLQQLPLRYGRRTVNTSTTPLTFVRGSNCSSSTTLETPPQYSACFSVRLIHM
ncbi:G-type lectin S-receptor-like serine/threonine-protein kinase LECRK1 [Macadamia integrifolia]|uniref:G-type lectin S-receptor-like serine/threonine-protein kinase LECRK1 n=1 Tax=Macadamia integrifolia TaxID=60698 RepID=UPI001C531308|nr:G-type lectin S-receptor-like serine/threonine-protein kinase LECRK1 [Macadamia integrifolia]